MPAPVIALIVAALILGAGTFLLLHGRGPVDEPEPVPLVDMPFGPIVVKVPADLVDKIQFIRLPDTEPERLTPIRTALAVLAEQIELDSRVSTYWRGDRYRDLLTADTYLGSLADWVGIDWTYLPPEQPEAEQPEAPRMAPPDPEQAANPWPIDEDIRAFAYEQHPGPDDVGPRTAVENTLQRRRDEDGDEILGVVVRCKDCGKVVGRGWRKTDEWRASRMCATCLWGIAGA